MAHDDKRKIDIDLERDLASNPIWATRGLAIQRYADLEQTLCKLFANLTGMKSDIAGIVFFKIVNTRARNGIIDKIIRKIYSGKYSLFWNSYLVQLRNIDTTRNHIVHWNTMHDIHIDAALEHTHEVKLMPPNFWNVSPDTPVLSLNDIKKFMEACDIFAKLCYAFQFTLNGRMSPDDNTWLEIFRRPLIYPLPEDHPLYSTQPIPEIGLLHLRRNLNL